MVQSIEHSFPDSLHVRDLDLQSADDRLIWQRARENEFVIVTKDDDFHHMSFVLGAPPKVIGLRLGNCTTEQVRSILLANVETLFPIYFSHGERLG
ncbi:MAG: hypothetical protein SynsKO_42700 [Synoicihabitans sp.]